MRSLLAPLGILHGSVSALRNTFYDRGWLKKVHVPSFVISIGNLSMGGTGKTPFVAALIEACEKKNLNSLVVSRNYKAEVQGIERVEAIHPRAAFYFGDEPTLLARRFTKVPVYVGAKKWQVAQKAVSEQKPQVVILDDGFQHRRLHRDLDLVLIDVSQGLESLYPFPWGKGREFATGLNRAHWVIFTKSQHLSADDMKRWRQILPPSAKSLFIQSKISSAALIGQPNSTQASPQKADFFRDRKVFAFCGLAEPESFYRMLREDWGVQLLGSNSFPDHHPYTAEDLVQLRAEFKASGAEFCLTTEKDEVKLLAFAEKLPSLWAAKLELECRDSVQSLHDVLATEVLSGF